MKRIALTGAIASGKSSVARALGERGYLVVEHADVLKQLLVDALASIGVVLTLEEIKANKAQYRTLLQEWGSAIGFDSGRYIGYALREAGWNEAEQDFKADRAVIDNVRTDAQAEAAKAWGFQVVRLNVSDYTRWDRLRASGVSATKIGQHESHPIERGISSSLIDYQVSSDVLSPEGFAEFLIGLGEEEKETTDAQANR